MLKNLKKILALLITITIVVSNISMEVVADDDISEEATVIEEESVEANSDNEPFVVGEDITKREENVKHFRMSDGSYVMAHYNIPVHYKHNGVWESIDNTLQESEETIDDYSEQSVGTYENTKNNFDVKFAKKSNSNFLLRIKQDDMSISWSVLSPKKNKVTGQATYNTETSDDPMLVNNLTSGMLYEDIFDDTDLQPLGMTVLVDAPM